MLGTGWAGGLSCLLSSVLSGVSGASPVLGLAGLLVWSGWDGLSSVLVWPGGDDTFSVRVGCGWLLPGLAGIAGIGRAPIGGLVILEVSGGSVISGSRWQSVWHGWDLLTVWLGVDDLVAGLAGLPGSVSLPAGESTLLGVSAGPVISVLLSFAV